MTECWRTTFVGIGVQKSASTWLHDVLNDHPNVVVGKEKEIDFFSYFWDRGFDWYRRQFPGGADTGVIATGEISPSYFHCSDAPKHVKKYNPEMRILLSLRDPVARAYSNHVHDIRQGFFMGSDLSFEAGLANNPAYVEQGMYASHLKRWLNEFSRERLLIVLQEDIIECPSTVARAMYDFVGVDPSYRSPIIDRRSNERQAVKSVGVAKTVERLRSTFVDSEYGGRWIWRSGKALGLKRIYEMLNVVPVGRLIPPMEAKTAEFLRAQFREDVEELEALLGRSLEHWKAESL